ncbi:MAG: glycosyltransferase [Gemmatimonadota bacterium]|nr:glycosyltransferase [Gemmatimonadota bacterium]MDH4349876.1 glycosyltransferase [Gemmatimonadota bacterium]MDH5197471.1 glycosyltransferase [Gemmatimonadota bacterium]
MTPVAATAPARARTAPRITPRSPVIRATSDGWLAHPRPHMYLGIFGAWAAALLWFHPRLATLLDAARSPVEWAALAFFVVFVEVAWLYAFYNIGVVVTAAVHRRWNRARRTDVQPLIVGQLPPVALLYTTYNDFVERSAESCVGQRYPAFHVYLLDDSTDPDAQARVDAFARRHPERVTVVRRADRRGFKAGNLNHALARVATEPIFALVDADELLPPTFLARMVPRLLSESQCGFVQANHRVNPHGRNELSRDVGLGIDIHWRWYQPLRNRFGFVMLLGHGAVVRRDAWETVGGFPEIVSEDLAFAVRLREHGWRGRFAEDVVCGEDFPDSVRAFRVRHMKWTRGTTEFLHRELGRLLKSRRIPWVEKLDILFPTLGLPLSLFWFLYLVDANLVLGTLLGETRQITFALGAQAFAFPVRTLGGAFHGIYSADFAVITLLTFLAPILSFIVELAHRPLVLFRFLGKSTALYATLGPLSFLGVCSYLATGRATFLVTGDRGTRGVTAPRGVGHRLRQFLTNTHPDQGLVQAFEIGTGLVFAFAAVVFFQPTTLGLALGFLLLPIMHRLSWEHPLAQLFLLLPFLLIVGGVALGGLALFGVQSVFFGYGFHF